MTARRLPGDLVALYAGSDRRVAILLRHTLVPLSEERPAWLAETESAAQAVAAALGLPPAALIVLQWRPPREVLQVTSDWRRLWVGDTTRLRELVEVASRRAEDERFVSQVVGGSPRARRADDLPPPIGTLPLARPDTPLAGPWPALAAWYRAMAPCWLGIEPSARRALVLRTHEWTAEYLLVPPAAPSRVALDLYPVLLRCLSPEDPGLWDPWIRLVIDDLERAAGVAAARRDEGWARRLFLIPYSLPAPRPVRARLEPADSYHPPWWAASASSSPIAGLRAILLPLLGPHARP